MIAELFIASQLLAAPTSADTACLLGNEAVDVRIDGQHLLIDALYRDGYPEDVLLDEATREALETAAAPYHDVDALLITHSHIDHFNKEAIQRHLQHNNSTRIIGNNLIGEMLKDTVPLNNLDTNAKDQTAPYVYRMANVRITALPFTHGTNQDNINNLAYLILSDDARIIHLGDSQASMDDLKDLIDEPITVDIAFAPWWYFHKQDNLTALHQMVKAKAYVPIHLPDPDKPFSTFDKMGGYENAIRTMTGMDKSTLYLKDGQCVTLKDPK